MKASHAYFLMVATWLVFGVTSTAHAHQNDVGLYGLIDVALRHADNAVAPGRSLTTMEDGAFTGSRLGWRGKEDLGGGMEAVVTMESGFDPSSGVSLQGTSTPDYGQVQASPRFWGRDIHVGLRASTWGLRLGRQYTVAHTMTSRFQPQGNPNNLALSIFSSHHVARQDNMVRADFKVGSIDVAASRTLGEVAGTSGSDAWALSASYDGARVWVGAYVQHLNNLADTETRKILGLGGSYKVSPRWTLYAGGMRRTNETSPQKNRVWTLSFSHALSPQMHLSAAYLVDDQTGTPLLKGARKVAYVTANYRFSRRTDLYVLIDNNRVRGGYAKPVFMGSMGSQQAISFGLRHRF